MVAFLETKTSSCKCFSIPLSLDSDVRLFNEQKELASEEQKKEYKLGDGKEINGEAVRTHENVLQLPLTLHKNGRLFN